MCLICLGVLNTDRLILNFVFRNLLGEIEHNESALNYAYFLFLWANATITFSLYLTISNFFPEKRQSVTSLRTMLKSNFSLFYPALVKTIECRVDLCNSQRRFKTFNPLKKHRNKQHKKFQPSSGMDLITDVLFYKCKY